MLLILDLETMTSGQMTSCKRLKVKVQYLCCRAVLGMGCVQSMALESQREGDKMKKQIAQNISCHFQFSKSLTWFDRTVLVNDGKSNKYWERNEMKRYQDSNEDNLRINNIGVKDREKQMKTTRKRKKQNMDKWILDGGMDRSKNGWMEG